MNIYNKILESFVNLRPGPGRDWQGKPCVIGDKAIATDSHAMVIVPSNKTTGIELLTEYSPDNVLNVIPDIDIQNHNLLIPMDIVKDKTEHIIKKREIIFKDCIACHGEGWVEYEFIHKDVRHTKDEECPICRGDGDRFAGYTGRDVYDGTLYFQIINCVYSAKLFDKAVYSADLLGLDEIIFTRQEPSQCSVLQLVDIKILLMPTTKKELEDEEQLITIL